MAFIDWDERLPWWWWRKPPEKKEVMVVNLTTAPIDEEGLRQAFAVSENILWWRGIMQTLETRRQECVDNAGAAAFYNNELQMAKKIGGAEILGEVIADLQKLRKKSVSE